MNACVQEFLDIDSIHDVCFSFMTGAFGKAGFRFYGIDCCCCAGRTGVVSPDRRTDQRNRYYGDFAAEGKQV
jgi:hypothetical protein